MGIYFKIFKYLFAGVLISLLVYMILSNVTVHIEIDEPTWLPPCSPGCPS